MNEYMLANQRLWNEWTDIHEKSALYDVDGFRRGKRRLHPLEIEEVGDVTDKSLLHLQCHFGLDTLSWADRGATVTGVDFSPRAVKLARSLATELNMPATFVEANVLELPDHLEGKFDIVFTSFGAIYWLPDIEQWGRVISHFLKPGGMFYIAEFHPFGYQFDDDACQRDLAVRYPYFVKEGPLQFEVEGTYADITATVAEKFEYAWPHTLGDIVTSLCKAGLVIEFLHEFPFTIYQQNSWVEKRADGYYHPLEGLTPVPLIFSIKAAKGSN
ncbi:MAG: class I SAM-dependent methyltransferase [Chthonomonadales bacterium]